MNRTEDEVRREIVEIGRWIYRNGFVTSYDGNISFRLDKHRILSAPTTICKGMMEPDDLVICDYDGNKISGRRNVTSEIAMHLLITGGARTRKRWSTPTRRRRQATPRPGYR